MVRTKMTSEEVNTVTKHFLAREQNIQKERNIIEIKKKRMATIQQTKTK